MRIDSSYIQQIDEYRLMSDILFFKSHKLYFICYVSFVGVKSRKWLFFLFYLVFLLIDFFSSYFNFFVCLDIYVLIGFIIINIII